MGYKRVGSRSAIEEGDLEPICFQLIDFQMVVILTVPGPSLLVIRPSKKAKIKEIPFGFSFI